MSTEAGSPGRRLPAWALGLGPLLLVVALLVAFWAAGGFGLSRNGIPLEEVAVSRTVLTPGQIELRLRNETGDPVRIAQVIVNDAYVPVEGLGDEEMGRLEGQTIRIPYDWIEGEAYEISLLTSTGGVIAAPIEVAAETPSRDAGFFGLMALLGLYVGIIPVSVGMLWLPFVRRASSALIRFLMAVTVGLLAFLAVDALVEGVEVAGGGPQVFGGSALVLLGALIAFVALGAVDSWLEGRGVGSPGSRLALLVAVGIGIHNLGEGLAIGSAYAIGELALGTFLVVGFALHNTTEGLAVVAPIAHEKPSWRRLVGLGLIAGSPAVLGAWIGGAAFSAPAASLLLGVGVGAIVQVVVKLAPSLRARAGAAIGPLAGGGLLVGLAVMYLTSLLIG